MTVPDEASVVRDAVAVRNRRPHARGSAIERALVLTSRSVELRLRGATIDAASTARAGLELIDGIHEERSAMLAFLPRMYAQLGMSLYAAGRADEAIEAFLKGYAEVGTADPASFANLSMLAGVHALDGDLVAATEYVLLARGEPWTEGQRTGHWGTFYRLAEARLALESADPRAAQRHLDAIDADRHASEHWIAIARTEALAALAAGDAAGALARLEQTAERRATDATSAESRHRLAPARMLLHVALGDLDAAQVILHRDAPHRPRTRIDRARIALVAGQPATALHELRPLAGAALTPMDHAHALAIEASAVLRMGADARGDAVVGQLGAVLRQTGQRTPLRFVPAADLEAVAKRGATLGYAEVFDPARHLGSALTEPVLAPELTRRERAVLGALARTASTNQIAATLHVSPNTVKTQLRGIYRKLGVQNRADALAAASGLRLDEE